MLGRCTRVRIALCIAVAACGRPAPSAAPAAVPRDAKISDAAPIGERWSLGATPVAGTAWIDVVRADLAHTRLRALTSTTPRTALEWRDAEHCSR